MDALTIVFDDWEQVLAATIPPDLRKPYREAIVKFRYWLRQTGKTPDAETFKRNMLNDTVGRAVTLSRVRS